MSVTSGAGMTPAGVYTESVSGSGGMTAQVYTASEGYYFPENYAAAPVNGIGVTRDSFTQITVSGAPTADAELTLPDAAAKVREATPTAVFAYTGPGTGTLSGVTAAHKYSVDGGATWKDVTGTAVTITGVTAAKGVQVKLPAADPNTRIDSSVQSITVGEYVPGSLTVNFTGNGGTGATAVWEADQPKAADVEQQITGAKNDGDPKDSTFVLLQAKGAAKSNTSIKLTWKKVPGAKQYVIYGNKCGKKNKYQKIKTVAGKSFTQKKRKKGTFYKYIVVAVNGDQVLATSKTIHVATQGGKYCNAKSLKTRAKKNKVSVKKGKTFALGAKAVPEPGSRKMKKHRAILFESADPAIASISKKGVIKGVAKGSCYVYAYAQNGVCAKIKVTVKSR